MAGPAVSAPAPAAAPPVVLWLPMPPDNANARGHWSRGYRVQRRYVGELETRRTVGLLTGPPATPPDCVRLDVLRLLSGRSRPIDRDNFWRRCKPLIDWLVRTGYLRDDDPSALVLGTVEQRRHDPTFTDAVPPLSSIRITITPLGDIPSRPAG